MKLMWTVSLLDNISYKKIKSREPLSARQLLAGDFEFPKKITSSYQFLLQALTFRTNYSLLAYSCNRYRSVAFVL